jgi:hypothetical protein
MKAGLAILALFVTASPALADWTHWKGVPEAGTPTQVVFCYAFTDGYQAEYGADFTNTQAAPLRSVRIRFDFYDAFGGILQSERGDVTGTYRQGVRAKQSGGTGGWVVGALHFAHLVNVSEVRCAIEKTLDADGQSWTNDSLPALAGIQDPTPTPTPK